MERMQTFDVQDRSGGLLTLDVFRYAGGGILRVSEIVNDYELMHLFDEE